MQLNVVAGRHSKKCLSLKNLHVSYLWCCRLPLFAKGNLIVMCVNPDSKAFDNLSVCLRCLFTVAFPLSAPTICAAGPPNVTVVLYAQLLIEKVPTG